MVTSAPPDCRVAGADGRVVAVSVGVAGDVPEQQCSTAVLRRPRPPQESLSDSELPSSSQRSGKACLQRLSASTRGWSLSSDRRRALAVDEHAA